MFICVFKEVKASRPPSAMSLSVGPFTPALNEMLDQSRSIFFSCCNDPTYSIFYFKTTMCDVVDSASLLSTSSQRVLLNTARDYLGHLSYSFSNPNLNSSPTLNLTQTQTPTLAVFCSFFHRIFLQCL